MDLLNSVAGSKKSNSESIQTSFRFDLPLKTSADADCPEFSFIELVREKVKKNKALFLNDDVDAGVQGSNDAEAIAKYFENKYGTGNKPSKKRRRDRVEDLTDVGYGYDETDPFVDNSECYDELIPSSLTTQFGGFYINSGKLEFKQVSDESNLDDEDSLPLSTHLNKKKNFHILSSDENSNDSVPIKKIKRKNSMEREEKRRKISFQGNEKLAKLNKSTKKKPTKVQLLVAKAKKAQHHLGSADKLTTNKSHSNSQKTVNGERANSEIVDDKSEEVALGKSRNNEAGYQSSSSDDVSLANLSTPKEESALPQSIPLNVKKKITSLTKIAKSNEKEGKVKFFSPDVNHLLLGIEAGSQSLSNRERSGIYQHLTPHMPCSKDTLIRRMKKLHASKQDENLRAPLVELKKAIDEVMSDQTRRYDEECAAQILAKLDDRAPFAASTDEDDDGTSAPPSGEEKTKRTYAPRRKFQWNDKIRSLFFDVIKIKLHQYDMNKSKQGIPVDDYLKNFLEAEVKSLWPKGWMQGRVLFKESRDVHGNVTGQQNKLKKASLAVSKKPGTKTDRKLVTPQSPASNKSSNSSSNLTSLSFKEASISMSMDLCSDPADGISPSKRAELMNRAILNARKEAGTLKLAGKTSNAVKAKRHCYVKLLSSFKEAESGSTQPTTGAKVSEKEHSNKQSESSKKTQKIVKANEKVPAVMSPPSVGAHVKSKNPSSKQIPVAKKMEAASKTANYAAKLSTSSKSSTSNSSSSKPSNSSSSSAPPSLDTFSAELLKLALMTPPGGSPLSIYSGNQSASFDELTKFLRQQQESLQKSFSSNQSVVSSTPNNQSNAVTDQRTNKSLSKAAGHQQLNNSQSKTAAHQQLNNSQSKAATHQLATNSQSKAALHQLASNNQSKASTHQLANNSQSKAVTHQLANNSQSKASTHQLANNSQSKAVTHHQAINQSIAMQKGSNISHQSKTAMQQISDRNAAMHQPADSSYSNAVMLKNSNSSLSKAATHQRLVSSQSSTSTLQRLVSSQSNAASHKQVLSSQPKVATHQRIANSQSDATIQQSPTTSSSQLSVDVQQRASSNQSKAATHQRAASNQLNAVTHQRATSNQSNAATYQQVANSHTAVATQQQSPNSSQVNAPMHQRAISCQSNTVAISSQSNTVTHQRAISNQSTIVTHPRTINSQTNAVTYQRATSNQSNFATHQILNCSSQSKAATNKNLSSSSQSQTSASQRFTSGKLNRGIQLSPGSNQSSSAAQHCLSGSKQSNSVTQQRHSDNSQSNSAAQQRHSDINQAHWPVGNHFLKSEKSKSESRWQLQSDPSSVVPCTPYSVSLPQTYFLPPAVGSQQAPTNRPPHQQSLSRSSGTTLPAGRASQSIDDSPLLFPRYTSPLMTSFPATFPQPGIDNNFFTPPSDHTFIPVNPSSSSRLDEAAMEAMLTARSKYEGRR